MRVPVRRHLRRKPSEPRVERADIPKLPADLRFEREAKLGKERFTVFAKSGRPGRFGMGSIQAGNVSIGKDLLREVGAYQIDKLLGWDVVPPTALRFDENGAIVSAQESAGKRKGWNDNEDWLKKVARTRDKTKMEKRSYSDFMKIALLDYILGQQDRHSGNFIVNKVTGHVAAIDNELALYGRPINRNIIQTVLKDRPIPPDLLEDLRGLDEGDLRAALAGIDKEKVDGAVGRLSQLIEEKKVLRWGAQWD